jgi:hypothetical protein
MQHKILRVAVSLAGVSLAWALAAGALAAPLPAQGEPKFAPPVRLMAGGKFLGGNRLFPSPVFRDMNGDGRLDIVVGDLFGRITVALQQPGAALSFAAETELNGADGKRLDFHNW